MKNHFKITVLSLLMVLAMLLSSCKGGEQKDPAVIGDNDAVSISRQAAFEEKIHNLHQRELEIDSLRSILENKHAELLEKEQALSRRHSDLISMETRIRSREMTSRIMMNMGYSLMLIGLILLLVSLLILRKLNKALYGSRQHEHEEDSEEDSEDEGDDTDKS